MGPFVEFQASGVAEGLSAGGALQGVLLVVPEVGLEVAEVG